MARLKKSGLFAPSRLISSTPRRSDGKRQYAAAKVSRLSGDWMPLGQSVNEILRTSAPAVTRRVRQLVRDFPYFARAANIMVDFTVGTGTTFQSRVLNPDWTHGAKGVPKFDRATSQKIEDAVSWAMEELDAAGRMHGADMERLAKREDVESGEFLFVKTALKNPRRYIPFALQAYEAEWLTDYNAAPVRGNRIEQGIEYDPKTGAVVAYHLTDPDNYARPQRIEAQHIIHGFDTLRSGQMRGISPFVTAVLIAHDLDEYLGATIDTAKLAAKYLALVTTEDPDTWQANRDAEDTTDENGGRQRVETLENAIIEYLRPGEQVNFPVNQNPGSTFDPFTKFILRTVAIATGVPFSALSGNHADFNYTGLRAERQDTLKSFAPHQTRHVRQFTSPVTREIITSAVLKGRLDLPGYFTDPRRYWRGLWIPPGMEPIDPLRESKSNRDDMGAGLNSPQRIAAKRGVDIEEIIDEIAEFQEMVDARGVYLETGSTALASAPSAVAGDARQLAALVSRAVEDAMDRRELLKETEE